MFNVARQGFGNPFQSNPFQSTVGSLLQQPSAVGSVGRCPFCGNTIAVGSTGQAQTGFHPIGAGGLMQQLGSQLGQQPGGFGQSPYSFSQGTGFGQINPLATQFGQGIPSPLQQMGTQGTGWQGLGHLAQQGIGGRTGAYGMDPRSLIGQQFGQIDPNVLSGWNPTIGTDPISSLLSQQINPLAQQQVNPFAQQVNPFAQQVNPFAQQQLPIRPLIGAQQQGLGGFQASLPGFGGTPQWQDPYRVLIEAQLLSQLANNPLYQLQRAYGGSPEPSILPFGGQQQFNPLFGHVPFGGQQQFNPLFGNVPFYGQ